MQYFLLLTLVERRAGVVCVVGSGAGGGGGGPTLALSYSHTRYSELPGTQGPDVVLEVVIVGGLLILLLLLLSISFTISSSLQNAAHLLQVISKY